MAGERPERNPDPDAPEARAQQNGTVGRAREPVVHDPLGGQPLRPREVFAEERSTSAGGDRPTGDGAVGEVLTANHVRRVSAGGAHEVVVNSE
jgi:hypothetical protein